MTKGQSALTLEAPIFLVIGLNSHWNKLGLDQKLDYAESHWHHVA
jgi:hypothetical protein